VNPIRIPSRPTAALGFLLLLAWMSGTGFLHAAHHADARDARHAARPDGGDDSTPGWHRHDGHGHAHATVDHAVDHDGTSRDAAGGEGSEHPHYRTDVASRPRAGNDAPLVALAPQALPEPAAPPLIRRPVEIAILESPQVRRLPAPSGPRAPPATPL
jgi:hypothetical protein